LGAKEVKLVKYITSGEVNSNMEKVVGYAGIIIKQPAIIVWAMNLTG
jgi:predicted class III extradiol MEMO1 family dioxygenase